MPGRQPRPHLPYDRWPRRLLCERAMSRDDPFATGAHFSKASRHEYLFEWREPTALEQYIA